MNKLQEIGKLTEQLRDSNQGGFVVIDVCKNCGKVNIEVCKHNSCYNHQCSCGYLTGFIGRNHAN